MDDSSAVRQENIIDYLLERFERGQIYTWIDTLLLAINPNGEISIDDIYDLSRVNDLYDVSRKELTPHIFTMAARAHFRIVQGFGKPSQVIVLNGETGTGKTFNAWRALEFLTARNAFVDKHRDQDAACCDFVQKITDACRLISAFTVASTEKNEISSRHVELVWLEYKMGRICGAMVSSYLLERNRVTMGHCNFQIFYQMMTALTDIEFADTGLSKDARYFMSSDLDSAKGQQLRDGFRDTLRAMDMLGFTKDQKKDIFQVLFLLIQMSNIRFTQEDDHCKIDIDDEQSKEALENTCKLAGLQKEDIAELFTSTLINPRSSWQRHTACRRNLNTEDACRYRLHSIIRYLYDLLFHWLIDSVNGILSTRLFSERLGILDVFGFECFDANGIEQLCVNYVNERLQCYFMEKYLEFRQKILQEEDLIDVEPPEIVRLYEDRLNTIEKRLFTTLNDICLSTVQSDLSTLIQQIYANGCPETKRFLKVRNENFVIQHYSGAVEYSVNDLLSKNIDKIPDEITVTFGVSKNTFLYCLINKNKLHHENGKTKKPTMLSKLRHNVDSLIQELNRCDAHYVRCIKPRRLDNREWDRNEFRRQLANIGILDALPLARCKYSIHFTYKEFSKRYCCKRTSDFRMGCKILASSCLTVNDDDLSIHYGKHFIFLTEYSFLQLESARKRLHIECVGKIESFWIKYRNNRRQSIKETEDVQTINNKNKLIGNSQLECKRIISIGICVYAETYRRQNTKRNTIRDDQAIFNIDIQDESTKKNQLENKYDMQLIDYSIIQEKPPFIPPNISYNKTAYIIHWLEDVSKAMNIKNIGPTRKQLLIAHNQLAIQLHDARSTRSNSNRSQMENRHKNNLGNYNKKEDIYIIRHGISTLFYKNGVLSRRRPARLPVKVHTRFTCLTNSHCLVHTELPQGLQDCL
ncbi:uncharacterized protein LOC126852803 [Cataglyphis hispanica]|uniref:uncharacterized protein LOC126852803 n=1 Tax=Cataglyphis hispanica TaxID=1086592 RepID=UPI0021807D4E|nr:uncharacterized protein LOC126852803 [Cataglyphis hispanica]